ncbi:pre-mRNA-splicing ATP-dependent RNA helicase prp28 [Microdochium bolleyi]|uniref:RNA helicase n=1 Tax=Microdochium bolleyi TaxID=196109 RepID=A0A136JF61_9PEZI|nr:pre-mRNA-splicing ATP-dependent RNA helicase prp28 [Microdochium bolleyi]
MAPGAITAGFKPKFIPKAERERLAKQKQEEEAKKQQALQNGSRSDSRSTRDPRDRESRVPTGPKAMRQDGPQDRSRNDGYRDDRRGDHRNGNSMGNSRSNKENAKKPNTEEQDVVSMRERYMGPDLSQSTFSATKKRKRTKREEFKFDWDTQEDTTGDLALSDEAQNEANIHKRARALREEAEDPEHGEMLARQLVEGYYRARDLAHEAKMQRERANEVKNRKVFSKRWTEKTLEEMQARDWRILREDFDISTKGGNVPHPLRNWRESSLPSKLLNVIDELGYAEPSPIQRATIPIAMEARDLIGVAVTGSGKTAAFLLPLLDYISKLPPITELTKNDGPYALIIAPTRELAQQIALAAEQFSRPFGFNVVTLIGGHQLEEQVYAMRNGAEIIVATPGRLVDCLERRVLVLSQCHYVIMDEADRMVEMGFEEPLKKTLDALPSMDNKQDTDFADGTHFASDNSFGNSQTRRTMMFTATMPAAVERIAKTYLQSPVIVTIGNQGEAVDTVEQRVEFVQGERQRHDRMLNIMNSGEFQPPIIVFVNMKQNCEAVAKEVRRNGYTVVTLHGNKTQEQRETALSALRNGTAKVLVATDLAGRGIDVPDVSLVINFNMAASIESYTHRIGRTGRAGKKGVAITFLGSEDAAVMYDLKQMISKSPVSKVPDALRQHEAAKQKPTRGRGD